MNTNFTTPSDKTPTPVRSRRTMRPNSLRNAQVLPPHNVDLTLSSSISDDVRVPANISGADLSRGHPADTRRAKSKDVRRP